MFNIGPLELLVLALVAIVVIGPDKLPEFAKEAAAMLRTLREIATGARQQLKDELGPEFADLDLRNLNPRTAVQRAVFGDDVDFGRLNPRNALRDAIFGDEDVQAADPRRVIRESRFDDEGERHDTTLYEAPGSGRPTALDTDDDLESVDLGATSERSRLSMTKPAPRAASPRATSPRAASPRAASPSAGLPSAASPSAASVDVASPGLMKAPSRPTATTGRPRPRPRPATPYDADAT